MTFSELSVEGRGKARDRLRTRSFLRLEEKQLFLRSGEAEGCPLQPVLCILGQRFLFVPSWRGWCGKRLSLRTSHRVCEIKKDSFCLTRFPSEVPAIILLTGQGWVGMAAPSCHFSQRPMGAPDGTWQRTSGAEQVCGCFSLDICVSALNYCTEVLVWHKEVGPLGCDLVQRTESWWLIGVFRQKVSLCQSTQWDRHEDPASADPSCTGAWTLVSPESRTASINQLYGCVYKPACEIVL